MSLLFNMNCYEHPIKLQFAPPPHSCNTNPLKFLTLWPKNWQHITAYHIKTTHLCVLIIMLNFFPNCWCLKQIIGTRSSKKHQQSKDLKHLVILQLVNFLFGIPCLDLNLRPQPWTRESWCSRLLGYGVSFTLLFHKLYHWFK